MAAAFFYGLPEQKIERVEMKRVRVSYAEDAVSGQPAMMDGEEENVCKWEFLQKYRNACSGGCSGDRAGWRCDCNGWD